MGHLKSDIFSADLVLINGKIITVDNDFSIVSAVAVKNGWIIALGTNEEIESTIGNGTEILDLQGQTMLPGINDSHLHASIFGGARPPLVLDVGFPTVKSVRDIGAMVGEKAKTVKPGEWIRGCGWDEGFIEECVKDPERQLTRWDLDTVSPNNPVCLFNMSYHSIWVNSKALELAGITADTPPPAGGEITMDPASGEPTGLLLEMPAMDMVTCKIPLWTNDQKRQAILSAMRELNSLGVTSVTEGALGPGGSTFQGGLADSECISIYNDLYNEGELTIRVNIMLLMGEYGKCTLGELEKGLIYLGIHSGFGNEWLKIGGVKLFADGSPPQKCSWMYEEYPGGGFGSLVVPGKTDEERYNELINMIVYAHECGFQLGIHSNGDRAIDAVVDGYIKAMNGQPNKLHHHVIHGDFTTDACAARMGEYGIGVIAQPGIKTVASDLMDRIMGAERSARHWPCRLFLDSGIPMAISSDAPVIYPDWRYSIQSAVMRESKTTGKVSGPEQCITVKEAIKAHTLGGAWIDHTDHIKGSIEVGKLADFCIIGEDILTVDAHKIMEISILKTIVGGKIVYSSE